MKDSGLFQLGGRKFWWLAAGLLGLALAGSGAWWLWPPPLSELKDHNPKTTRLMELRRQQAAKRHRPYRVSQRWMPLGRISEHLRHAVLAAEDDAFYRHSGVDFNATWICLKHDLKHRGYVQGGSTITQQVVKNLYLSPRKSLLRKLKEAVLALQMERVLSKRRILEIYLNIAEWGRGVFGAEAAAQAYFGKSAADLTVDEAVALVAVLPSPLRHSPVREDRFLGWRKPWVLRQMQSLGYLPAAVPAEEVQLDAGEFQEELQAESGDDLPDDEPPWAAGPGTTSTAQAPAPAGETAGGAVTAPTAPLNAGVPTTTATTPESAVQ